tara:strand:- start:1254 stop:1829 length:576 start_codon:yes stop_codon:yes gene_type:complete
MGLLKIFGKKKNIVIDVISLYEALGIKGDVSPRTQLQILRRLTRFADRESINMIAILGGKPLHKAPNKKKFDNIIVLYSSSKERHHKFVAKIAIKKNALLLTDNIEVEKLVGQSVEKMRLSTFRKVFDVNIEGDFGDHNDTTRIRRRRKNRNPRLDNTKTNYDSRSSLNSEKNQPLKGDSDAINELIDLVD